MSDDKINYFQSILTFFQNLDVSWTIGIIASIITIISIPIVLQQLRQLREEKHHKKQQTRKVSNSQSQLSTSRKAVCLPQRIWRIFA